VTTTTRRKETPALWTRERYYFFMALTLIVGLTWIIITRVPVSARQTPTTQAPRPGFLAPDFELPDLEGNMVKLSDFRGHPVVLNFWATWCPPCRAEMPAIVREYNRYQDEGLIVLGINQAEDPGKVINFQRQYNMTFPILLDTKMRVADTYRIRALPTTFFITPDGTIIDKVEGGMNSAMVQARFKHLMEAR